MPHGLALDDDAGWKPTRGFGIRHDDLRAVDAITAAMNGKTSIKLLVKEFNGYRTVTLDYHEGLRYPRLERIEGTPDRLSKMFAARK